MGIVLGGSGAVFGSNTVNAYCWKFLPFRYHFVEEVDKSIGYHLTTIRDFD